MYNEYGEDSYWYTHCSCGRKWECDQKVFCKNHGKDTEHVDLNSNDVETFISYMKPLHEILFYLKDKPEYEFHFIQLEREMLELLCYLNRDCIEYNRMTTILLEISFESGETIFEGLLKRDMFLELFEEMKMDGLFREKFLKLFIKLKEKGSLSDHYRLFAHFIKRDVELFEKLTEQEQEFLKVYPLLENQEEDREIEKLIMIEYRLKNKMRFSRYVQEKANTYNNSFTFT